MLPLILTFKYRQKGNISTHHHENVAAFLIGFSYNVCSFYYLLLQTESQYTSILNVSALHSSHLSEILLEPQEILA